MARKFESRYHSQIRGLDMIFNRWCSVPRFGRHFAPDGQGTKTATPSAHVGNRAACVPRPRYPTLQITGRAATLQLLPRTQGMYYTQSWDILPLQKGTIIF